jgi:hypothetical protein
MSESVTFYPPFKWCETSFDIGESGPALRREGCQLTLVVRTGAACLQTYATRDELRALGEMLLRHANANEVLEVSE